MFRNPAYSASQLKQYFSHIRLPDTYRLLSPGADLPPQKAVAHVAALERHQLATVPWENLSKHYSKYPTPTPAVLYPNAIFNKIVGSNAPGHAGGRGGGCLENNALFGGVLRGLGYNVYPAGGRVHMGDGMYTAWEHMVNIVSIGGQKYMVDVGFGAKGSTAPLPLIDDPNLIHPAIAPAAVRLIRASLPQHTDRSQRLWIYQHREDDNSCWADIYAFTEMEFLATDFQMVTVSTTFRRNSFFSYTLAMARMMLASEVGAHGAGETERLDEVVGLVTMSDRTIKRTIHGKKEIVAEFENEEQRLEGLKKWFGIEFSEEEKQGIIRTASWAALQKALE